MFLDRRRGAEPGIHALIIGIGHYPFLTGNHLRYDGSADLRSAPVSALRFLDCLLDDAAGPWSRPVSTVDVLLSPVRELVDPDGVAVPVADPTRRNIQAAFDGWLDRCRSDPDNVAVLYFCGHGVQTDEHILLASDFAESDNNPFLGSFAFDTSRDGLLTQLPRTQCLFVDACRVHLTEEVRRKRLLGAGPLIAPEDYAERLCRHDLTLRAPFLDEFGAPDGEAPVSYFTAALVKALEGQAGEEDPDTGAWLVSNESISRAMTTLLQRELGEATGQAVEGARIYQPAVLRRLAAAPSTEVRVRWDPEITSGVVRCTPRLPARPEHRSAASARQPWRFPAEAGHYVATAECDQGSYVAEQRPFLALPPTADVRVRRQR
ncbi:hypothetical protein BJY16_005124 [Actinoplanes octamycinicus]|uniref:Peptidase C14 caspase domain-containing protein n=1 Tax=Actinoplanes octamycinicus TaxID=135948 RepID=A0A7W7H0E2_9ACTN|nr:caspase family protein [Actinoplanes octamycinicus]MBB4741665.1 hypothetical protein [Actinoplanes octamycinicus]GIE57218.1 hypothetical protein Aoc01nite_26200 [Actinoplanes octamycinicus]